MGAVRRRSASAVEGAVTLLGTQRTEQAQRSLRSAVLSSSTWPNVSSSADCCAGRASSGVRETELSRPLRAAASEQCLAQTAGKPTPQTGRIAVRENSRKLEADPKRTAVA